MQALHRLRAVLASCALIAAAVAATAAPASAHVSVAPEVAPGGQLTTFTLTVPSELPDQATMALDVTLPDRVELESAQAVPGWTTTVLRRPDRTARAVRWTAGHLPAGEFTTFALRAMVPAGLENLTWRSVQHYERATVAWTGPPGAAEPASVTKIISQVAGDSGVVADVPAAVALAARSTGTDELARARAALSLTVGGLASLLALGTLVLVARRRTAAAPQESPVPRAGRQRADR